MTLPFTVDEFLGVFRRYNLAVWPAQVALVLLALWVVALAYRGRPSSSRVVFGVLAVLWLWMAVAYHIAFFASVNPAAVAFGVVFAVQAGLFAWHAKRPADRDVRPAGRVTHAVGTWAVAYALVGYPIAGYLLDHRLPAAPTFGVPCPTTIFTLGILAWMSGRWSWRLHAIPLAWAVVATTAAVRLGMVEDFGLLVTAVAVTACVALPRGRAPALARPAATERPLGTLLPPRL